MDAHFAGGSVRAASSQQMQDDSSSYVPDSPFSTPGGSYSYSFNVNSTPAVFHVTSDGFQAPVTNFTYTLNGNNVSVTPLVVEFLTAADDGLLVICFSTCTGTDIPDTGFALDGDVLFTGSQFAPTITPGNYAETQNDFALDGQPYSIPSGTLDVTQGSTVTPEPSAFALLGTGLLGLGGCLPSRLTC